MIDKKIEIVSSKTKDFSSMSNPSRQAIYELLKEYYLDIKISLIDSINDLDNLIKRKPDLVFLGMEFLPKNHKLGIRCPNKIWLSEHLDENNIAYTGSTKEAHIAERYKDIAKLQIQNAGLKTSPYFLAVQNVPIINSKLITYPLFVKPNDRGGGIGIDSQSVVYNFKELQNKINHIAKTYQADSLVEQYLPGREFSVAILKSNSTNSYDAMPIEIIAEQNINGQRILGEDAKKADKEKVMLVPGTLLNSKLSTLALKSFVALGGRDYGRIDIRLDNNGQPNFLEANLIPSLIKDYGNFPKACKLHLNLSYQQMIMQIIGLGLKRSTKKIPHNKYGADNKATLLPSLT